MRAPAPGYMSDYVATGANTSTKKQYTLSEALHVKELYTITGLYFCAVPAYLLLSAIFSLHMELIKDLQQQWQR